MAVVKKVLTHPLLGLLVVGVVVSVLVGEFWLGLLATVAGYLAGLLALQTGMLVGALALGVSVRSVVIGVGPRVGDWSTARRAVVLRAVPLFLSVAVGPGRAPARPTMWAAAVVSALAGIAATVVLAFAWIVLGVACGLTVGHALAPRKTAGNTSTGWLIVHLLRLRGGEAERLDAAPVVAATIDATVDGDLDHADDLARRLEVDHPTLRTARAARTLVHQARGRYAEGLVIAMAMIEDNPTPAEAARFFAALADLALESVEAGQVDRDLGLPTAVTALESAEALGYPAHKLTGTKALHALLTGDTTQALTLARRAVDGNDDRIGRVDDLATLARAHMAAHDNRKARETIEEAEKSVPWWPRVMTTRARLDV